MNTVVRTFVARTEYVVRSWACSLMMYNNIASIAEESSDVVQIPEVNCRPRRNGSVAKLGFVSLDSMGKNWWKKRNKSNDKMSRRDVRQ